MAASSNDNDLDDCPDLDSYVEDNLMQGDEVGRRRGRGKGWHVICLEVLNRAGV